jgi:hypothetical protein
MTWEIAIAISQPEWPCSPKQTPVFERVASATPS